MAEPREPVEQSALWRFGSSTVMGVVGLLVGGFMHGPCRQEVHGLDPFLELLNERADVARRKRGLITVSNHISVMDDPLLWAALPWRHHFNPNNSRWSLASYDICFNKNKPLDLFWSLGQTLPTHRLRHSPHGGLYQPTMREAVRLLSKPPLTHTNPTTSPSISQPDQHTPHISDPFSDMYPYYTTNGHDRFPRPSAYTNRAHAWIHIFPEGKVHQHPRRSMRYFKWGIARLILEPDVCPDIVPMWIEGTEKIMPEDRGWPRFLPRVGKQVGIWIGDNVGGDEIAESEKGRGNVFHELRKRWRALVQQEQTQQYRPLGDLSEELKYGAAAVALREECTRQVRRAVLELRRARGLDDEDPKAGLAETWALEGPRQEGRMDDGSLVKDT